MTTVARLSADLYANSSTFEGSLKRANRAMNQARGEWDSALGRASRSFSNFDSHVKNSLNSVIDLKSQIGGLATAAASALSIQKIVQYSDMWKQTQSRLSLVTEDMRDMTIVQQQLFNIAQKNSAPVIETADAYVRLMNSTTDAQKAQFNMLNITDLLAKTLKISGANAQGSAIFLQQFGQAASNDFKAIGQELQTFADQNPTFYKIIRYAAQETGKSLKQMAQEGGLSFAFIANALQKNAEQIERDASGIALTVGQALTQLDNAFLKFIGQNDLAVAGTSSLAAAISALAQNFGYLALAAGTVATVFAARLLTSATAAAGAMLLGTLRTTAFNYQLGILAFGSRAASVAMVGLAGATTALGTAIAFLGGPLGVALLGTLAMMASHTNAAADAQMALNVQVGEHRAYVQEYITASAERRKAIKADTLANIESYKMELLALEKLATALDNENFIFRGARKLGAKMGIDTDAAGVRALAGDIQKAMTELETQLANYDRVAGAAGGGGTGTGSGSKKKDTYKDIVDGLKQESDLLASQIKMYGQKESAVSKAQEAIKIQNKLNEAGLKLTAQQQAEITKYLDAIEKQTELQNRQAEQTRKQEEAERDREQALNQLGATFESSFEKAIVDGEKLSDVMQSLFKDIEKLLFRLVVTEPLTNGIVSIFKNSSTDTGGNGGFLSGLFDWLPSFDVGTNRVPRDMIAQVHKGEMIVPAFDVNKIGGGGVNINVINNAGAKVNATAEERGNGTDITIMVERLVADGLNTPGSPINSAMKAYNNKTLVRR